MNVLTNISRFFSTDVKKGWWICNIFFAAWPIIIALSWDNLDYYPTILAYCYALLVVGAYLFYRHLKLPTSEEKDDDERKTAINNIDTVFWVSVFAAFALLYLLSQYASGGVIDKAIHFHYSVTMITSLIIIAISFYLVYKLNWPMINKEELAEKRASKNYLEAEKTRKQVRADKGEIAKVAEEGNSGN